MLPGASRQPSATQAANGGGFFPPPPRGPFATKAAAPTSKQKDAAVGKMAFAEKLAARQGPVEISS